MWRTPHGEMALKGSLRKLFIEGATSLLDFLVENDGDWGTDYPHFDNLPNEKKANMVMFVLKALTEKSTPAPEIMAWHEVSIMAVFSHIKSNISLDIDYEGDSDWKDSGTRDLAVRAMKEEWQDSMSEMEDWSPPDKNSSHEDWHSEIDMLSDSIFHDRDFEMGDLFMDENPDKASSVKEFMGIEEDYYTAIPPLPPKRYRVTKDVYKELGLGVRESLRVYA